MSERIKTYAFKVKLTLPVPELLKSGSFFVSGSTSDDARWTLAPPRPQTPVLMVLAGPFCFNVFL